VLRDVICFLAVVDIDHQSMTGAQYSPSDDKVAMEGKG